VKAFILDASMALAWFFPHPEDEAATLDKRSLFDERVALVPSIWRAEIVNFIARQHNEGAISAAQAAETLHQIEQLPMGIVDDPAPGELLALATRFRLTAYDALYLHAAMVSGEPLATLDAGLSRAAREAGVELA
jgi:predicted nucleic acid-binding protein